MQKTAALYFCTPDPALFLHSGFMKLFDLLFISRSQAAVWEREKS